MARKRKPKLPPPAAPAESQASVFFTVGWSLCVLATLIGTVTAGLVWLVVRNRPENEAGLALAQLMHFSAIVTGCASLFLLPVVYKVRREPPPLVLIGLSLLVAAAPILAAVL
ncbi:MAG: hypothetical protein AB7O59_11365 [Pirellulales bacterium]